VVEDPEDVSGAGADQRVIERGDEIDEDEGGGEDGAAPPAMARAAPMPWVMALARISPRWKVEFTGR
jgi:hypothetical protein